MPTLKLSTVAIKHEQDVLLARQRARYISDFLGFSSGDATRITTALSEIARNGLEYGGGAIVGFALESHPQNGQELVITVTDRGAGISDITAVLAPTFKSSSGMGIGIKGTRALMDRFDISSPPGDGTTVVMAKSLPRAAARFGALDAARLTDELAKAIEATPLGELQRQNQALLNTLHELTLHQAEIARLGLIADEARDAADTARAIAARSLVVRERFMALTTHEFRTPLNAILGYLDLLDLELSVSLTETQRNYVDRIGNAARHLTTMTNDFLEMAQNDAGRLHVARTTCDASDAMNEAASFLAPQAAARNVTVRVPETAHHLMFMGDVNRVRQVLINVLGNAVSFTPVGGRVTLAAERIAAAPSGTALASGDWIAIRVQDTGPGIPDDKLSHVFEAFVQVSTDEQATRKSTGLGLTVSRQLALLMGGDLTAASDTSGALFTLWLPAAAGASEGTTP